MTLRFLLIFALCVGGFETRLSAAIQVYFSPNGGCTDAIVRTIDGAKKSVLVQAYSFTATNIARALNAAQKRGVHVSVILDDSNQTEKYSAGTYLKNAGITTLIDSRHGIAHNKIIIVDEIIVVTGSFNFSKAAETSNAENVLIISDAVVAKKYVTNWRKHAKHSTPYVRKKSAPKKSNPKSFWDHLFGR